MNSVLLLTALLASLQLTAFAQGAWKDNLSQILHVILTQNQFLLVARMDHQERKENKD